MKKFILLLLLGLWPILSFSQISEDELIRKMDSIRASVNPNDPDFEDKMQKGMLYLRTLLENAAIANDTMNIDGIEQAENIWGGMEILWQEEKGDMFQKLEYASEMRVIIIDLQENDSVFNINNLNRFSHMKTLFIRGGKKPVALDFSEIINQLDGKDLEELYITNCKKGLTFIPENIKLLKSLRILGLYGNEITVVPKSIGELTELEVLYLDLNPISAIPNTFKNLKKLNTLGLASTNISLSHMNYLIGEYPKIKILQK